VKEHQPAEGVTPFVINSRQWQDGATAEYLLALPGDAPVTLYNNARPVPGLVNWHNFRMHFPKDAVLARTLSPSDQRLETQLLHYDGLEWRAYTYAWRDDQADADLVPADGDEKEIRIGKETRLWQFHSRSQCLSCHNNQSQYALAFSPEQLNCDAPSLTRRASEDRSERRNQLIALTESGYIRRADNDKTLPPFDSKSLARERKLVDPRDDKEPLEARARSYLHANCGHCHSDHGGGAVPLRLQFPLEVANMKAVDVPPTRGDFGLADARIIAPGDPHASTLYFRMAKFGRDRMPHIGSELPDEAGLELIAKWIESLKERGSGSDVDLARVDLAAADAKTSLVIARKLGRDEVRPAERAALLAAAAKLPVGPTRDLFEGYLPAGGERKLGSSPRPKAILALKGDAARGDKLFWSQAVNCGKCHRVGERGTAVGPDLSKIGGERAAGDLLDSLLAPSRRIEPKFATYMAQTADGRVIVGVLVSRDEKVVILRESQGKEITLATGDIEQLRPSPISLMPEGQLSGLTAQDAADLLEFLRERK
jgi:putative heme-binding domain-containing protein